MIAASEGWTSIVLPVTGFRGKDLMPVPNSNPYVMMFFMVFFFFGNLIIINVFIGLTIYNFKKIKE